MSSHHATQQGLPTSLRTSTRLPTPHLHELRRKEGGGGGPCHAAAPKLGGLVLHQAALVGHVVHALPNVPCPPPRAAA